MQDIAGGEEFPDLGRILPEADPFLGAVAFTPDSEICRRRTPVTLPLGVSDEEEKREKKIFVLVVDCGQSFDQLGRIAASASDLAHRQADVNPDSHEFFLDLGVRRRVPQLYVCLNCRPRRRGSRQSQQSLERSVFQRTVSGRGATSAVDGPLKNAALQALLALP